MAQQRETHTDVIPDSTYPVDYTGSAPAPARVADNAGFTEPYHLMQSPGGAKYVNPQENPNDPTLQDPALKAVKSTTPPANPAQAAELDEYKQKFGELLDSVGKMRRDHDRENQELRLMLEMNQNLGRNPGPTQQGLPQLPPGTDLNKELTLGDMLQVRKSVVPVMQSGAQAQAIRAAWDVTSEEEAAVLRDYPNLQTTQDPDRSRFVQRAVQLRRQASEAAVTPTPTPVPIVPVPQQRAAAPTVPQPEAALQQSVAEPATVSLMEKAQEAYATAQARLKTGNIPDSSRKELLNQMREAKDVIDAQLGKNEDSLRHERLISKT